MSTIAFRLKSLGRSLLLLAVVPLLLWSGWRVAAEGTVQRRQSQQNRPQQQKQKKARNAADDIKDPLLKSFANELDDADDLEDDEYDSAIKILREADPVLQRVRRQNREALDRAKVPPKIGLKHRST